ncbi:methyl-accepting chemotaxis protein, partial [bacterium]|nr:methyl-accepting chemotaxis protein [bacterium]
MFRSIKVKIMMLSILAVLITSLVLVAVVLFTKGPLMKKVSDDFREMGKLETAKIATSVYDRCVSSREQRQELVNMSLMVAHEQLAKMGSVTFNRGNMVSWDAVNQFSKDTTPVSLPAMEIGGTWLGKNSDAKVATPLVDKVREMVGGTATVFQRMNDAGDMLRVATNVIGDDGKRAVGTYIPAVNPDGTSNPVISSVLSGNTYQGTAFVVNENYLTAYEPIMDRNGDVVGILYVGVTELDPELYKWITSLVVGKTGYVFVIGGNDPHKGFYLISKDGDGDGKGDRDGDNIWEAKDANDRLFIQDMVNQATAAPQGEINYIEYPWLNEGDPAPKMKVSAVTYFEPMDWVIGAGTYYADFEDTVVAVGSRMNNLVWLTIIIAFVLVVIGVVISFWMAGSIGNPLIRLAGVAELAAGGDLTVSPPKVVSRDEVGQMTDAFTVMLKNTHQAVSAVYKAAADIAAASEELSAGADETGR